MNLPDRLPTQTRVGIAIEIPAPFDAELQAARARFGDVLADAIPPHITLLGPTVLDADELAVARTHLAAVARGGEPFQVHLKGSASFRPISPVVFVQVLEGFEECERLESRVRSGPLFQRLRFSYHPHVTVAHEVDDAALDRALVEMADYEAAFDVSGIHLYEHGDDGVWRPQQHFALGGRAADAGGSAPS
ncbi:2'-5' RNA ligase family protein [Oerskovia flava]|uniref:2'-5' RNA ligase family protein n=1 Tax=Oerskovia flava TaxID=2986422 RepID=UPI00223FEB93|nr:2'-5' RNA ligase family protein [Oerskovia sp. JB1-3-2]